MTLSAVIASTATGPPRNDVVGPMPFAISYMPHACYNSGMVSLLHTFNPQPILVELGWFSIRWYGLLMVIGIIAGIAVVVRLARRDTISQDTVFDLAFYLILFSLLGARIYAVLLELPYYLKNPGEIIAVWHGGLAIHGAIIGGALTLLLYCWRKRQSFWQWADRLVVALPLGQAIGRWGNYFNQELFGKPTDLAWGIPISPANRPTEFLSSAYFHPTFLYESLLNFLNFALLFFLFSKLSNRRGVLAGVYLINYAIIRITMEQLRIDSTPLWFGVRLPVVVSAFLIAAGAVLTIGGFRRSRRGLTV